MLYYAMLVLLFIWAWFGLAFLYLLRNPFKIDCLNKFEKVLMLPLLIVRKIFKD